MSKAEQLIDEYLGEAFTGKESGVIAKAVKDAGFKTKSKLVDMGNIMVELKEMPSGADKKKLKELVMKAAKDADINAKAVSFSQRGNPPRDTYWLVVK